MALTLSTVIASFGPELMEKVTKLQPAASAVGSLNSKVSAIRQDTSDTGGQDSKRVANPSQRVNCGKFLK